MKSSILDSHPEDYLILRDYMDGTSSISARKGSATQTINPHGVDIHGSSIALVMKS